MNVKVIRQFLNGSEVVHEGTSIVVSDRRGKQLIANNLVAPADVGSGSRERRAAQRAGAQRPIEGQAAPQRSTSTPKQASAAARTGGPTGEATPRSSSRRGRPRKTPPSALVEAERVS